jgi:pyrroloquinoline quinone biosynthesis protein D
MNIMNEGAPGEPMCPGTRPRLAAKARLQTDKVSGKPALLYPEGVLLLNPTGAAILELCDGQRTFAEMVTTLAARYNSSPESLSGDVAEYLGRLRERGLLEWVMGEGS